MDEYILKEQNHAYKGLDVRPDDVVLDIGAHIGTFARRIVDAGARVVCVEPEVDNLRLLRRNVPEATIIPAALAADVGWTTLYLSPGTNTGSHSLEIKGGRKVTEQVQTVAFSTVLNLHDFTVVKCDIEGGEYALPWGRLPDSVKQVAMELHLNRREWRSIGAPVIVRTLEQIGFTAIKQPKIGDKNWHTTGVWSR